MTISESALLQTSNLHSWIGIVAADKAHDAVTISVMIPELTPVASGTVDVATSTQSVSLTDIKGNTINSSVTTGNTITAYYFGGRTNSKYPPDVVKGEQVRITKLSNSDRYYWESMGRDDKLRKTEIHRIEVANRSKFEDPMDDDHTYSAEIDTRGNQHIRLQTSKGNGEKFTHVLKLDAKNSQIQLSDDAGNSLVIDSANSKILMRNAKKAFVLLNGEDITIAAPRDLTIKAGRQMLLTSPLMTLNAAGGSGVMALIATAIAQTATSAITLTAPAIGLTGAVQIPSVLTVNKVRAGLYTNGAVGATYPVATHDLGSGTGNSGNASGDTAIPSSQRHAAAWEDVNTAMTTITECFTEIRNRIGVPTQHTTIPATSTASEMTALTGT